MVQAAGGQVWFGDSPAGPLERGPAVYQETGMVAAAQRVGAQMVPFDRVAWTRLGERDYYLAPPVLEADLVINLPKLKTHVFTLFSGGVKNLFGAVTGTCKRDLHYEAPGVEDFSRILVDVMSLVRPSLTIMDGVCGLEGHGPGAGGTAHWYQCVAVSADPVALDTVIAGAMGYQPGAVLHLRQAAERGLGVDDLERIRVVGDRDALGFGRLELPGLHWYFAVPSWIGVPLRATARVRPEVDAAACTGCGQGAIAPHETIAARIVEGIVRRFGVVQW
jgi:uncharacterized protein (DUF362 family)